MQRGRSSSAAGVKVGDACPRQIARALASSCRPSMRLRCDPVEIDMILSRYRPRKTSPTGFHNQSNTFIF